MSKKRQTKQKETIMSICLNSPNALTIEDIHTKAKKTISSLNLATVYRNINKLVDEGILAKFLILKKEPFMKKLASLITTTFLLRL